MRAFARISPANQATEAPGRATPEHSHDARSIIHRPRARTDHVLGDDLSQVRTHSRPAAFQAKLRIGHPDDQYEREADRVADQMIEMPEPARATPVSGARGIQRKYACEDGAAEADSCDDCTKKKTSVQRKVSSEPVKSRLDAPASVHQVLSGSGRPLDSPLRYDMEERFGHDFSQVRVHTDGAAQQSARDVDAQAYTVGNQIVFGVSRFSPETTEGRRLLAHELTHTIQQGGGGIVGAAPLRRTLGDGHDLQSARFAGDIVLEACFDDERLLQFGATGPAVARVQQALVDAGFPLPVFGVDGIFESETASAVRSFQQARGLASDGIVGPITMASLDAQFAAPAPPAPAPAPPAPAPAPPAAPAPPGPAPAPPGPAPATPKSITSQTVVTSPGPRTRTTIGVGEDVKLTHSPGTAAWTTTAGTLSSRQAVTVLFTAPDTAQAVTVTAGTATIRFTVLAPTSVFMDREPGTGVKHTVNRPDSGIQSRVFLGPDTVNFSNLRYRELDVDATATVPGAYACLTGTGHCSAGGGGNPCPDKAVTTTVVAGQGTQSDRGDCAFSGDCGAPPPFVAGSISLSIPYEYRVGTNPFRPITNVSQGHSLAADLVTLTTNKAGANGATTVAAPSVVIPQCL